MRFIRSDLTDCGFTFTKTEHVRAFVPDFDRFERCRDDTVTLIRFALREPDTARAIVASWSPEHRRDIAATVRDMSQLLQAKSPLREWASLRAETERCLEVLK